MNEEKISTSSLLFSLDQLLSIIQNGIPAKSKKRIPLNELHELVLKANRLLENVESDIKRSSELVIKRYIPILNNLMLVETDPKRKYDYINSLKNCYKIASRVSLRHYFVYREWGEKSQFYKPRRKMLEGYIHYLQEIDSNPVFEWLIVCMPSGYGKLIANDIPVLTKDGWKKHGDLKVGDYVISPNGEFVRVNIVHPKRLANCRVTFEDGEEILCHNQHEWQVYDRFANKIKDRVETTYLINNLKEKSGRNRFYIPLREMVKGEEKELPVDPYTYGVWLGDGTTKQGKITQNNNDILIFDYIPYKITSVQKGVNDNVNSYYLTGLSNDLHKLGLCYQNKKVEKFIHDMYLTSSIEQRLELLAGIIDTDGYLDKVKQRYIITTCGEKLKDDIVSLISTFGWRVCVTATSPITSTSGIIGKKDTYYIGFSPTIKIPCKLKRKQLDRVHKQRRIGFSNIELIKPTEGNCITVDGGLYLVGRTLKTTHNTFPEKVSEAWSFGKDSQGTILSICSNDDVVKGGSRTVIDEIKSQAFGEVFPDLKYDKTDKTFFLKETDENWKLRDCKLLASYYATTTKSNTVGERASKRVHIDDLYPDPKEAMNTSLNQYYYDKFQTVWKKRFLQELQYHKIVITGTLWSSDDFIARIISWLSSMYKFEKDPNYKYTKICKNEKGEITGAIVRIPALDYETNESVCPELRSTEKILEDKNAIDDYLFQTNFQQIPTDPESLFFSYNSLRTYETVPPSEYIGTYSVIDATRKSGKDFFSMPIFRKLQNDAIFDYYLIDCLFTKTATKDLYQEIVNKIIENHIIKLVIESNVTTELAKNIREILKSMGITWCEIIEKYNTIPKPIRIENEKGVIKRQLVFPKKGMYGPNTDMGKFMNNLTMYNNTGSNPNDDAPDSCALMSSEIIEGNSMPSKAVAVPDIRKYF